MTVPIPIPLPKWAKFVLRYGPAAGGFLWSLVDYLRQEDDAEVLQWRKVMIRFSDSTSADAKDDAFTSIDLVNVTGGTVDSSWTSGDYTTAETALDTWLNALRPMLRGNCVVDKYQWYKRMFNPYSVSKPFADSGPPDRVTTKSISGTGTVNHAAQVAFTITEKTPWPKHWGRMYIGPMGHILTSSGRISSANVDAIATATNTLYGALGDAELFPVVPVTQLDKDPRRCLLGVTQIQVDDVPDVIRRRRLAGTTYRKILP